MWPCQVGLLEGRAHDFSSRDAFWFCWFCWCVFTYLHTTILHNVTGFTDLLDNLAVGDGRMMVKRTWSMMLVLSVATTVSIPDGELEVEPTYNWNQLNIVQFHVPCHSDISWPLGGTSNSFQLATLPGLSFFEVAPKHLACTPQTPDRWRWSNPFCDDHRK